MNNELDKLIADMGSIPDMSRLPVFANFIRKILLSRTDAKYIDMIRVSSITKYLGISRWGIDSTTNRFKRGQRAFPSIVDLLLKKGIISDREALLIENYFFTHIWGDKKDV